MARNLIWRNKSDFKGSITTPAANYALLLTPDPPTSLSFRFKSPYPFLNCWTYNHACTVCVNVKPFSSSMYRLSEAGV
jgi:hypothetical protein